jgi:hypothetical protein
MRGITSWRSISCSWRPNVAVSELPVGGFPGVFEISILGGRTGMRGVDGDLGGFHHKPHLGGGV